MFAILVGTAYAISFPGAWRPSGVLAHLILAVLARSKELLFTFVSS